jgi:hypothetical protein
MIVFVHLPKTAGTSLNSILKLKYKNIINYGGVHSMNQNEENNIIKYKDQNYLLSGHISYCELSQLKISTKHMFTILRNPIERCISWYYFTNMGKNILGKKISLKEFFSCNNEHILQNCYNRMTYQIGNYAEYIKRSKNEIKVLNVAKDNISNFKFVIIFENLNEDLYTYLNIDKLPKKNITKTYNKNIDKEIIEKIKNWNKLDIELYNFVLNKLGKRYLKFKIL